jgi:hypothetical protein
VLAARRVEAEASPRFEPRFGVDFASVPIARPAGALMRQQERMDIAEIESGGLAMEEMPGCHSRSGVPFFYGCYCGKGKTCEDFGCPPIDELDEACRVHDIGYGDCGFFKRGNPSSECCPITAKADVELCKTAMDIGATATGRKRRFAKLITNTFCTHVPCTAPAAPPGGKQ